MASSKEKFLKKLDQVLPDFAKPTDLANLKVFGDRSTLLSDRRAKRGIPFIQTSKNRTKYAKEDVLKYADDHFHDLEGGK